MLPPLPLSTPLSLCAHTVNLDAHHLHALRCKSDLEFSRIAHCLQNESTEEGCARHAEINQATRGGGAAETHGAQNHSEQAAHQSYSAEALFPYKCLITQDAQLFTLLRYAYPTGSALKHPAPPLLASWRLPILRFLLITAAPSSNIPC